MSRCIILLILFSTRGETILAQPFDTIITRFQYLSQIYPLEDSTFILIGQKNGVVIERMNSKAEAIWTIILGDARDDIIKSVVHCEVRDSSIQVYTARRDCDIYDGKNVIIYALTFNGVLLDSLIVPYQDYPLNIQLLSGHPEFPRLAYIPNSSPTDLDVILMFQSGDTMHIRPTIPGLDSNDQSIIGKPVCITLSPDSMILVNTHGFFTFFFKKTNGRYNVVDRSFATGWKARDLFALEKDHFITVYEDYLTLFHKDYEINRISIPPQNYLTSIKWQNPYLVLTQGNSIGKDSVFIYDKKLNVIDKRLLDDFRHYPLDVSYRNQTYYWTSRSYHYLEGAAIHSMSIDSLDEPGVFDVGILDVNVPAYDGYTTTYSCSKIAYYHFPYIILTVVNHSETVISHIDVIQEYSCICPAWHWIRPIDNMDLQPGETDTFWLRDITIANVFGTRYPLEFCLDIIHPDFHRDANTFPDNDICKTITLRESFPFSEEEIIRYFPNPATENLTLYTEDTISYEVDVFDTNGRYVYETQQYKGGYSEIDVSNLPQGIFYLRFRFKNGIITQGVFTKL